MYIVNIVVQNKIYICDNLLKVMQFLQLLVQRVIYKFFKIIKLALSCIYVYMSMHMCARTHTYQNKHVTLVRLSIFENDPQFKENYITKNPR